MQDDFRWTETVIFIEYRHLVVNPRTIPFAGGRGSSSVLFAYLFLLLFGQIGNIYKVEQDSLYFFLEGAFKGIYLRERNFTLSYVVSEI